MKRIYIVLAAAVCAFAACSDNAALEDSGTIVFQASVEDPDTKLALVVNDGKYQNYWTSSDKVSIFDEGGVEHSFAVTPISTGATATLKGTGIFGGTEYSKNTETGNITFNKTIYAVHPRNSSITISAGDLLTLPQNLGMKQNQIGVKDGFPTDPNTSATIFSGVKVGKSTNGYFKFVNLSSYIKFTITEDNIGKVTLNTCDSAKEGPFIGGGPLILDYTGDTPQISYENATAKWGSISLIKNTSNTEALEPGTYYMNIMPINFNTLRGEDGGCYFKIQLYLVNGANPAKNIFAKNPVNITPGMVLDLGTITTGGVVVE